MSEDKESEHESSEKKLRGILRRGSNESVSKRPGGFQWDEANILETYHPIDKTYGFMKIDEAKTPYVYDDEMSSGCQPSLTGPTFQPEELAAKLTAAMNEDEKQPKSAALTTEEEEHQRKFRAKRRAHYNEYLAIKMAKERIASSDENADDDDDPRLKAASKEAARNALINAASSQKPRLRSSEPVSEKE